MPDYATDQTPPSVPGAGFPFPRNRHNGHNANDVGTGAVAAELNRDPPLRAALKRLTKISDEMETLAGNLLNARLTLRSGGPVPGGVRKAEAGSSMGLYDELEALIDRMEASVLEAHINYKAIAAEIG